MRFQLFSLSALALTAYAGLEACKHSKELNIHNFDSSIQGKATLAAFFAPWCGHCKTLAPAWDQLAQALENEEKVVVAHVDADNADNRPLAQRYNVQGFPTIKYFPADGSAPLDYKMGRTAEAMLEYINSNAGTFREISGSLSNMAGRIPSLDSIAAAFWAAEGASRNSLSETASKIAATFNGTQSTTAQYYLKAMQKVGESKDYVEKESARLKKMTEKKGQLAASKVEEMKIRENILAAFTASQVSVDDAMKVANEYLSSASSLVADATASIASGAAEASASVASGVDEAASVASDATESVKSAASEATEAVKKATGEL